MSSELIFSLNIILGLIVIYIAENRRGDLKLSKTFFKLVGYFNLVWGISGCILLILGHK